MRITNNTLDNITIEFPNNMDSIYINKIWGFSTEKTINSNDTMISDNIIMLFGPDKLYLKSNTLGKYINFYHKNIKNILCDIPIINPYLTQQYYDIDEQLTINSKLNIKTIDFHLVDENDNYVDFNNQKCYIKIKFL